MDEPRLSPAEISMARARRRFIQALAAGTAVTTLGGIAYVIAGRGADEQFAAHLVNGRRRLPPGQRALVEQPQGLDVEPAPDNNLPAEAPQPKLVRVDATTKDRARIPPGQTERESLKPMGGQAGDPSRGSYTLKVHGAVENELSLNFEELLELPQVEQTCDVHCVTTWSALGVLFRGARVADIAALCKPKKSARHVIFEAAGGYTANIDIDEALKPNSLVTWELNGRALAQAHGAPVRNLLPDRYFWKSAKWLTGIRFVEHDQRGYWEVRGYHNHADPWKEERYSSQE
jgi:DMSO/TMAO reductase YedYZ molybdopterin-dependent catalytic subunit